MLFVTIEKNYYCILLFFKILILKILEINFHPFKNLESKRLLLRRIIETGIDENGMESFGTL
jgi:hypothetical protein